MQFRIDSLDLNSSFTFFSLDSLLFPLTKSYHFECMNFRNLTPFLSTFPGGSSDPITCYKYFRVFGMAQLSHLFIHSFSKSLLREYYLPCTLIATGDSGVKEKKRGEGLGGEDKFLLSGSLSFTEEV